MGMYKQGPITSAWPEWAVAILTREWKLGLSAAQVAKVLNAANLTSPEPYPTRKSRNAVLGKAFRLYLPGHAVQQIRSVKVVKPPRVRAVRAPSLPKAILPPPVPPREVARLASGEIIGVQTLTRSMCRYPLGDPKSEGFGYCGQGINHAGPYCGNCSRLAYQPRRGPAPRQPLSASDRFVMGVGR